ncbi:MULTISPECIES: ABC transporter substrate-binding protein [Kribbella]|uniref:Peptide/nickel transport system substrate-binding protein n=1 Tax=Kribbella pratensis TaxID=2512112 RepID=A0ABY2FP85_9ACTN|nr:MULTISPECIES: ABC transporter substrate-binding protein [Kribbella]TDW94589.1 peptide/nickel transport system substrate-binding protein [Kribbella pratensis]TDX03179.1 peptide/nickel transport system substrate-binding protein [Kribbella sp. VKM Ac-2566]
MSPTGTNDSGTNGKGASALTNAISRRHVLQIFGIAGVGAAGIGSVTACSPSKPNASGGDSGKSGNKEFHGAYPYQLPPKGHFNLAAGVTDGIQASNSPYFDLVYPSAGMYYWADKKWEWMMAESGTLDEATKTYTLKLRSGLTWSDGKPVTAKDVVSTFNLRWLLRQQDWTFLSDVSAKDDTTVLFTIATPSTVLERYILRAGILPDSVYGEWATKAEALRKAKTSLDSAEGKKLNGDFQKFRPENPVVSGPFNFDVKSMTNAQMSLVKNDKGLFADKIGFTKVVLYNGETSDISPVVLNKDVDYATHGFAVATEKTLQSSGFRILRPPVYSGPSLVFNYTAHPELADARVRQAIAYVLDRNENGTVALGDSGKPCKFMAGFSDILVPDWISDADQKKLQAYEKDEAKATSLLTEAGWKKNGGKWTLPNGKPAAYDIKFPTEFADWNPAATNAADQLNKFGFNITKRGITFTQLNPDVLAGKFDIAIQGWGASSHPHPYFAFVQDLYTFNYVIAANSGGKGMNFPLKQTTSAGPIDLQQVVDKSAQGLNVDEQKKNITTAAMAFNELLPIIPLWERYGNNPALEGTRVAKFPADDDPILKNAPYADNFVIMGMYKGSVAPV